MAALGAPGTASLEAIHPSSGEGVSALLFQVIDKDGVLMTAPFPLKGPHSS